jgi:putative peptidoglycan lipid II flippase
VTPVLLNLSVIAAAWWGAPRLAAMGVQPILALAGGVMLGGVLQLAVQMPALAAVGCLPRIGLAPAAIAHAWRHPGVRQVLRQMAPAMLGVSVAQISLLINTQIATHVAVGAVSWLTYADRLMEFPTALLGVALGVVLLPQLSLRAPATTRRPIPACSTGAAPGAAAGLALCAGAADHSAGTGGVLYHYGAFNARDVANTVLALRGYGVGLLGLVAIKVLAPAFYARQDIRTPVKIAMGVLLATQAMNLVLVPWLGHAGLALSIGVGAWINAGLLLAGLLRLGVYRPQPGWGLCHARGAGERGAGRCCCTARQRAFDWIGLQARWGLRAGAMAGVITSAALVYGGHVLALAACGRATWCAGPDLHWRRWPDPCTLRRPPRWITSPPWWRTMPACPCWKRLWRWHRTTTPRWTCRACWRRSTRWPSA